MHTLRGSGGRNLHAHSNAAPTFLVVLAGLLIAALLLNRGIAVIAAAIVLTTTILQPDLIGLDRDLLLAALLLTVLYPIVSRIMHH